MKKQNKKLITLLLAGALCCSAAFGIANLQTVKTFADDTNTETTATEATFELTKLFTTGSLVKGKKQATLQLANNEEAGYKNAVALKWFDGSKDQTTDKYTAKYFTLKFAFADANFDEITLSMDTASSVASEKGKATNKIIFKNNNTDATAEGKLVLTVSVLADGEDKTKAVKIADSLEVSLGEVLTLSLTESEACKYSDQFEVVFSGANVAKAHGLFKNVGANYAAYSTEDEKEKYPLQFSATTKETAASTQEKREYEKTQIQLHELNGQKFDDVKEGDKVEDTAAPILVVNQEVKGFMLGSSFSWSNSEKSNIVPEYMVIDVVKASLSSTETVIEYYQYNPDDEEIEYATLNSSKYFAKTVYELNGKRTSVFEQNNGEEFVSIRFTLSDDVYKKDGVNENKKPQEYYLTWYADEEALREQDAPTDPVTKQEYIVLNLKEEGAKFAMGSGANEAYVIADDADKVNKYLHKDDQGNPSYTTEYAGSELEKFVNAYNELLAGKASKIFAGNAAEMQFPTLEGLFYDDNGYRNLAFTICYKTKNSGSSVGGSNLAYSGLKLSANTASVYEVKFFATDKADNKMKFYLDEELVEVTSSNIWDIDAIPTFTYEVKSQGLKIQNEDTQKAINRTTTKALNETYTFSGITVVGAAEDQKSEFALYKLDLGAWNNLNLKTNALTSVTYYEIRKHIEDNNLLAKVGKKDAEGNIQYKTYFDLYLDVYVTFLAEDLSRDKDTIKACFIRIEKYNARITEDDREWDLYNKYEFQKNSNSSFKIADDGGVYIMFADYYDDLKPTFSRVSAYKVIRAVEKADVIKGETQWLKDNLVSVILFSIAAVMLILIIILLLIKPSDETLEDVDEKAKGKVKNVVKTEKKAKK